MGMGGKIKRILKRKKSKKFNKKWFFFWGGGILCMWVGEEQIQKDFRKKKVKEI